MQLNTLSPDEGAKKSKKRVGRGIGSGTGKTCTRGHKGQRSRRGATRGYTGFEGGQMPLQMRLPKSGFTSQKALHKKELTLAEVSSVEGNVVNRATLSKAGLITRVTTTVKVILSGKIERAVTLEGIAATKGAKLAIEAAGGSVIIADKGKGNT